MIFIENFKLAIGSFVHSKMRTALSALGIVIGVASVIAITTLGGSATGSIEDSIVGAGLQSITIMRGRNAAAEVERLFDLELADRLVQEVEGVAAAVPLISTQATLSRGQEQYDGVTVMAVDTRFPDIYQYDLAEGAFIDDENDRRRESVVVLGVDIAEALFPDEGAIGERIRIFRDQARSFKVIGVMKTASDSMGMSFDTSVYIPVSTYDARLQKIDGVMRYGISADRDADVLEVSAALENWFLTETGDTEAVRVMSPATMAEMFKGVTETLNLFLTGVAAISLLVGGIGIMNIMLVSVTERTREIGVRKALGATPRVIRRQFLVEAAALTTLGGTLGVFVGLGVSAIGVRALGWNFTANIGAVAAAVVFSAAVGLFFGLYPAARASRLDPVEALAYE